MDTEAAAADAPRGAPGMTPGGVRLADRYDISPGAALPEFASPRAPAHAAADIRGGARALLAWLCPRHLGLRDEVLANVRRIERQQVLRVVDWGVVDWPTAAGGTVRQPVVISERPGGGRVMPRETGRIEPLSEDALVRRVLRPLSIALRDLQTVGVLHRGIRADNLFWRDGSAGEAVLGESWIGLPGAEQPALYETIANGMAHPAGRGPGRVGDDMYALGATLAVLAAGSAPLAKLDDHGIIAAKLNLGSFVALAGSLRLSTPMAEVLRGLLADNPQDRWTIDDLELWFDGRRLSPKPPSLPLQAARPMAFAGADFWSRPALAHGLAARWSEAVPFAAEAGISVWLRRSLGDEVCASQVDAALVSAGEAGRNGPDNQFARLLIALDPAAPLRYRDIAAQIDGLGGLLAESLERGPLLQQFAQIIVQKLPANWIDAQGAPRPEYAPMRKLVEMMSFLLGRSSPGFGLERCLYEANPGLPCRSPLLEDAYVTRIQDLLQGLDSVARRGDASAELIDRHVAAFIGARLGTAGDSDLMRFGNAEAASERCIGLLRLLAMVQAQTGAYDLHGLGAWLAGQLKPLVDSFHHRPFKEALAAEAGEMCYRGDFAGIVRLVERDELRRRDASGFAAARKRFAALNHEAHWIRSGGLTTGRRVQEMAQQTATVASSSIAVAVGAVILLMMWG